MTKFAILLIIPAASWGQRMLTATPSVLRPDAGGYGEVTLSWRALNSASVQIRVNAADGDVFVEGGPTGQATTGHWVTAGTRFFLQDGNLTLATLTMRDTPPPEPGALHYIAVSATSYTRSIYDPPGAVLLFDRDTADQIAAITFPAPAVPAAVSADGTTLYVAVENMLTLVDIASAQTRSYVPVLNLRFKILPVGDLLLAATFDGVAVADPQGDPRVGPRTVFCPSPSEWLLYSPGTRITYAVSSINTSVCVLTPDLQAAAPIVLPARPDGALLLDDLLLVTGGQRSVVAAYGKPTLAVPSLDGYYPLLVRNRTLYALRDGATQRFSWTIGADAVPVFTPLGELVPGVRPTLGDDRFVYGGIPGSCSTIEGPVVCNVGFQMLDPITLAPAASVVLARGASFGLFGGRAIGLGVAASYRVPPRSHSLPGPPIRRGPRK